jgi:hypothetical protein
MKLDKLSMQFSTHETDRVGEILEAYERLILDAMRDDHTLFTTAEGIESLWERSEPLLQDPLPVRPYAPGSWGPNSIHQLVAPHWRLRSGRPGGPRGDHLSRANGEDGGWEILHTLRCLGSPATGRSRCSIGSGSSATTLFA